MHIGIFFMGPDMMLLQTLGVITVLFSLQSSGSIQWPAGTYGIPKPIAGCPRAVGFRWLTGWRLQRGPYQDKGSESNNSRSREFHIDGKVDKIAVNRSFCMKEVTRNDLNYKRPTWPQGKYCIYKGSDRLCPEGLTFGWVFWSDSYENDKYEGYVPDGIQSQLTLTQINFCCRTDGDKDEPILLPTQSPFFLLAYESAKCQMVKWAVASLEWIYYSTSGLKDDQRNGSYPYNGGTMHPTIYYCYYQGCNKTLTAVNGTLKSPKYPKHYPNGQYCSWKIIVNTTQQIHIVFKSFSLQYESLTDELLAYDGEDETGEVLGVFYGGYPPPKEGIYSSSNRMFLIFKSDRTHSYKGFSASYFVDKKPVPRVTTTKAPAPSARITSPHFLTSETSITSGITPSTTVTTSKTQTSKLTSSPVVFTTTAKTSKLPSSSRTRAWDWTSSSTIISMTLQTPEVTHLSPITPTAHTLIQTTPGGKQSTSTTKMSTMIGYNETLTAVNGTFQSLNCPRNYPDGRCCFWRITVFTAQQIYLTFSSFSLQNENNRDALYVYEGDNATGEALEVFYGGHPPPKEGICISSNQIFIVFNKAGSSHGFSASYYGVSNSNPCPIAARNTPGLNSTHEPSKESGKKDERKQAQRKGFNVVAIAAPVVSAIILLAALLVAAICYIRKRRKREGPNDEIYLRLNNEPTASVENTDL